MIHWRLRGRDGELRRLSVGDKIRICPIGRGTKITVLDTERVDMEIGLTVRSFTLPDVSPEKVEYDFFAFLSALTGLCFRLAELDREKCIATYLVIAP